MLNAKPAETIRLVSGEDAAVVVVGSDEETYFRSIGFVGEAEPVEEKADEPPKRGPGRPKKVTG